MQGSRIVTVGPVAIGCISTEARDLLDTIMDQWEQHIDQIHKHTPDYEPTPYGMAYWLTRWSGLIQPAVGPDDGSGEAPDIDDDEAVDDLLHKAKQCGESELDGLKELLDQMVASELAIDAAVRLEDVAPADPSAYALGGSHYCADCAPVLDDCIVNEGEVITEADFPTRFVLCDECGCEVFGRDLEEELPQ